MANIIGSRHIAEHLCAFATLLEAEAMRASTLGIRLNKDLAREAAEVRGMADRLWEADAPIVVDAAVPLVEHGAGQRIGLVQAKPCSQPGTVHPTRSASA